MCIMDAMIIDACKMCMQQGSFIMARLWSIALVCGEWMLPFCHVITSDSVLASSDGLLPSASIP